MSILRSSKYLKSFLWLTRNHINTHSNILSYGLLQNSSLDLGFNNKRFSTVTSNDSVEQYVRKLDYEVRRMGRVTRKELQGVFDEIRLTKHATTTQSLMVIRCCGDLVPDETPEVKTKLVNEIWETFEKLGVPMDVSHYNALLRVYLENDHKFSPIEFLKNLEQKGIEPNRVTYQRLIAAFCQNGDIDGATQILEFMKEKQMPVNESVFNALITGHSESNDMESALGILTVMKQANLQPSSDTYTALMCGYAKHGDIDAINALFKECQALQIELPDKDILGVVHALAVNDHKQHVLSKVQKTVGYNLCAKHAILRLITRGEDDVALKVFDTMTSLNEDFHGSHGGFLIKQLVRSNRPVSTIISFCNEIKNKSGNPHGLSIATETSLLTGDPERSLELLTAMAEQEPTCQHYYWPVLVQFGKVRNTQGIIRTLKQMIAEVGQQPSLETLRDYAVPYLPEGERAVQELRKAGVFLSTASAAIVSHLLNLNQLKAATKIGLVTAFVKENDVESLVTIVRVMEECESEDSEPGGRVLLEILKVLRNDKAKIVTDILNRYLEAGIGISNSVAEAVQEKLTGEEMTQEISTLLSKLAAPELTLSQLERPPPIKLSFEQDHDSLLRSIKMLEEKGESPKGLYRQLLSFYCHNKELEKAVELKEKLERENFEFAIGLKALLMDLFVHHENLEEALNYYKQVIEAGGGKDLDDTKVVRLAHLMCKNNKIEDALALFKSHSKSEVPQNLGYFYASTCWRILNYLSEEGNAENLKLIFDSLVENNFIEPNNVLLGPLIKIHLAKDDIEGALKQFEECCNKYKSTPWKNEIACKLIQNEDANNLQRLTDLSTQIHGEFNSLYDLVMSFIECGRIRQARTILVTPGLKNRTGRITSACERYTNEGKVSHLESLVEATKDLHHINRGDIYFHLLKSYCKSDEVDKAFGLWTQMQDEDVQPSDSFLITLAEILKKHERTVPFDIPKIQTSETVAKPTQTLNVAPPSVMSKIKSLRRAVYAKELDEALEIRDKLSPEDLSNSDRANLLSLVINSGRTREATKMLLDWLQLNLLPPKKVLSFAINSIAKTGDVDSLLEIEKFLDNETKKSVSFTNRLTHAVVEAGRAEDVMNNLLKRSQEAKTKEEMETVSDQFPSGGIFSVLNKHPELLTKMEEIEKEHLAKGFLRPTNILWCHYTLENDPKAEEKWESLKSSPVLMIKPITNKYRSNKDLNGVEKLIDHFSKNKMSPILLGLAYSAKLDILVSLGQENECDKTLEEALKVCDLEHLSRVALIRVKKSYLAIGKEFIYEIPARRRSKMEDSSSSSSDSEDEKDEKKN